MFQIAAAIGYARRYGCDWGAPSFARESGIHRCWPNLPRCDMQLRRINEHPNTVCVQHWVHYDICHYDYHDIPNYGDNICLIGFYQSWKYFKDVHDEVKRIFPLDHVPDYFDCCSIHVRRGDYVQYAKSFPPVDINYIRQAIDKINQQTGCARFLFFSDDIGWCKAASKDLLPGFVYEFSEGRGELQDLSLMASCGHHIIANSSYSWWAAYLGKNRDRVVVCPSVKRGNWYGIESGVKRDVVDLPLPEWMQIEFR